MVNDLHPFGLQYISSCINAQQFSQCQWRVVDISVQLCSGLLVFGHYCLCSQDTIAYVDVYFKRFFHLNSLFSYSRAFCTKQPKTCSPSKLL